MQNIQKQQAPEQTKDITFQFNGVRLVGNTARSTEELSQIWAPYLHREISVAMIYDFAAEITKRYSDKGYALSFAFIPEQEIGEDGVVTIKVIEGFIEKAVFVDENGDNIEPDGMIAGMAEKIVRSKPLMTRDLERYLLLMNDIPGYRVETTFTASKTVPNASVFIVKIKHQKYSAQLTANNFLSSSLDYWTMGATGMVNGFFSSTDELRLLQECGIKCSTYSHTAFAWAGVLNDEGIRVTANVDLTNITPSNGLLSNLDFSGQNLGVTVDVNYPWIRSRQKNLNVDASLTIANNKTETFFGPLTRDHVRTLDLSASYDFSSPEGAISLLRLDLNQGLPIFGETKDDDPLRSKVLGSSTFTNVILTATRNQPLGAFSQKLAPYSLFASARGQVAVTNPLLSASQCFYGGRDFGRGYDSGTIGGDHCLVGSLELRRDWQFTNAGVQGYIFSDGGAVWRKGNLSAGEKQYINAESAGAGFRFMINDDIQGNFEVAMPLTSAATSNGKKTPRAAFSLNWYY